MKVDTIMKHSEQCALQNVSNGNRVVMINKIYREKWLNVPVHKATVIIIINCTFASQTQSYSRQLRLCHSTAYTIHVVT